MYNQQIQENPLLLKKKEDQVYCNNSLGMLLSSMESLLKKSNNDITILFGYYNHFNDISWKTRQQIKEQVYIDLMAYKISKMAFLKKYGDFDGPDYPSIQDIKNIIQNWIKFCKDSEEKQLCQEILDLISDENQKTLSFYQNRVENIKSYSHADPVEQFYFSNQIHDQIDKRNFNIKQKLEENPRVQFGLYMREEPGKSEFSHLQIPNSYVYVDPNKLKLEEDIKNQINNLVKNLYACNICYKDDVQLLKNNLDEYYKKYKNLNFLDKKTDIKKIYDYGSKNQSNNVKSLIDKIKSFSNNNEFY